ncbi:histone H2A.Z-specific chaperone CHZ1 isoform X1 [Capsicum annuum]|uniref:histone H2A.Z-specific chaperone CHZ1 isoform X1 n=1 Tax=Capsicum annuum TaxID=4072 RepID=UPI001FB09CDE|nr:histone H2A.Z-specific chaperone CHZ1 isoform X1 [Capsicum annuum]
MGCFLGCFGFTSKKQKRIKPCNKFQVHQKYVPLESENANVADSTNSETRDKPKESSKRKVKKKVSFNLDVKTYERIQDDDNTTNFSEEEEKTQREYNKQETAKASMSMYPSSYRYYNCNDEEEDEITLEDSDIDDLEDDEDEEEEDYGVSEDDDDAGGGDGYNSLHIETENKFGNVEKLSKDESNEVGRHRKNTVLLPVENLTQWKAVKARGAMQVRQQKENIIKLDGKQELPNSKPKPQGHEIPVDASLSNWLVSARTTSVNGSSVFYVQDRAADQVVLDEVNLI